MQQLKLFGADTVDMRSYESENICAMFRSLGENSHEAVLEINSNKFLINFSTAMKTIENLEVIAIRGFIDLSVNIIRVIKKIVYKLYFEA